MLLIGKPIQESEIKLHSYTTTDRTHLQPAKHAYYEIWHHKAHYVGATQN